MNRIRSISRGVLVFGVVLIGAVMAFGQGEAKRRVDPSYDVTLQVIIGSNDAGQRGELPANLATVSHDLKGNFAFSNYRLASTLMGRIADMGTFEYKSVSNVLGQESTGSSPTFLDWALINFRSTSNEKGPMSFQAQVFRFGARVPVVTGSSESGKPISMINYESIGITANKIGLAENVPTLVGNLSLPGTSGTVFLVITVKASGN